MSNTMKVISNQGEIYISQQEHKRYKNIELFGYGYIDWGRVINQSLVTLYDLIDSIQDGGVSEIEFNLENYEEQQKVLRKDEFTTWKNEFKNLLTMEINKYQTQVSTILENYNDTISEIRETTTTSIQENYENLSKEVGGIYTQVEKTIDEQIQINIRSLVERINLANQNVESASQQLSQATSSMNASVQEVNNLIVNFKTTFEESFNQFKTEVERTLIAYKDTLIKYIDSSAMPLCVLIKIISASDWTPARTTSSGFLSAPMLTIKHPACCSSLSISKRPCSCTSVDARSTLRPVSFSLTSLLLKYGVHISTCSRVFVKISFGIANDSPAGALPFFADGLSVSSKTLGPRDLST